MYSSTPPSQALENAFHQAATAWMFTLPAAVILIVVGILVRGRRKLRLAVWGLLGIMVLGLVGWGWWGYRRGELKGQCGRRLNAIAIALADYEELHGRFPPAVTVNAEGQHMHSWVVNILPFIGEEDLYARYDSTVPWDHPNNRQVVGTPLPQLQCPALTCDRPVTHYRMVVCPDSVCGIGRGARIEDIFDGTLNTFLLAEVAEPVPWASPAAIVDPRRGINWPGGPSSCHPGGVWFAVAETRVLLLGEDVDHTTLRWMCTKRGEEFQDTKYY